MRTRTTFDCEMSIGVPLSLYPSRSVYQWRVMAIMKSANACNSNNRPSALEASFYCTEVYQGMRGIDNFEGTYARARRVRYSFSDFSVTIHAEMRGIHARFSQLYTRVRMRVYFF